MKENSNILKETIISGFLLLIIPLSIFFSFQMFFSSHGVIRGSFRVILLSIIPILLFAIPLTVAIYSGKKHLLLDKSKKILYKMPKASIIPAIIAAIFYEIFIWTTCEGEACMGIIIWPIYSPIYILIIAAISFVFGLLMLYFKEHQKFKSKIIYTILGIALILVVISLFSIGSCDSTRNSDDFNCFSKKAIENNDYQICFKMSRLEHRCLAKYAIAKNDPSICKQTAPNDETLCLYEVARGLNDESICDLAPRPEACKSF